MNIQTVLYYEGRDVRELSPDELVHLVMKLHSENVALKDEAAARSKQRINDVARRSRPSAVVM